MISLLLFLPFKREYYLNYRIITTLKTLQGKLKRKQSDPKRNKKVKNSKEVVGGIKKRKTEGKDGSWKEFD